MLATFLHQFSCVKKNNNKQPTISDRNRNERGGNFPSFPNGKPLEPADWHPPRPG